MYVTCETELGVFLCAVSYLPTVLVLASVLCCLVFVQDLLE